MPVAGSRHPQSDYLALAVRITEKGYTATEFAEHIGFSVKQVQRWLWGRSHVPRLVMLYAQRGLPTRRAVQRGEAP